MKCVFGGDDGGRCYSSCRCCIVFACEMAVFCGKCVGGRWLLISSCFQPSLLDGNATYSIAKRRAECVSLSLPVHSLSTASPVQYFHVVAGVTGYCEAPALNPQGRNQCDPTVEQAEEKKNPNGCDRG